MIIRTKPETDDVRNYESIHIGSAPEADGRGTEPSEILPGAINKLLEDKGALICSPILAVSFSSRGLELNRGVNWSVLALKIQSSCRKYPILMP
ncbi:Pantothenate synthetase [Fusarium oxysporum f. sp. albedinis]|nr:Pantothenate synthetase [Fusarium oxysporum f. sp. albedinis]